MFKFSLPMTITSSSSSCLALLAIGSLLLMSNTVHTSDINQTTSSDTFASTFTAEPLIPEATINNDKNSLSGSRSRSGRSYNQNVYGSGSSGSGTSQQALDSYAAAYAAANSPASSSADQSASGHLMQQQQVNDASIYSSFGETPSAGSPASSGQTSPASAARQMASAEFGPHANYYASYMSPSTNDITYSGGQQQQHHHQQQQQHYAPNHNHHHHYRTPSASSIPMGYPTNAAYDRSANYYNHYAHYQPATSTPFWASSATSGTGGLMSSASSALSHWTNGFSISEIICGLVAIAIGAVILGAPFFLIYLALMGNFSGSGSLTLTNPTQGAATPGGASTTVNGRRKRLAVFEQSFNMDNDNKKDRTSEYVALADSVIGHLSPYVNFQQISGTFKQLMDSMEKYSHHSKDGHKQGRVGMRTF